MSDLWTLKKGFRYGTTLNYPYYHSVPIRLLVICFCALFWHIHTYKLWSNCARNTKIGMCDLWTIRKSFRYGTNLNYPYYHSDPILLIVPDNAFSTLFIVYITHIQYCTFAMDFCSQLYPNN